MLSTYYFSSCIAESIKVLAHKIINTTKKEVKNEF